METILRGLSRAVLALAIAMAASAATAQVEYKVPGLADFSGPYADLTKHFVARDADRAEPGDLLFYRQEGDHMPFHSMIYLGASQIAKDAGRYLVYHTGPDAGGPGEIRRPTLDELRRFPEPDWRPLPENPRFLGVFRWNILRKIS